MSAPEAYLMTSLAAGLSAAVALDGDLTDLAQAQYGPHVAGWLRAVATSVHAGLIAQATLGAEHPGVGPA